MNDQQKALALPTTDKGIADLTLEQKVRLLTGADFWALQPEPVLGLRRIVTSDGPAGVRGELWDERDSSVCIPSPTAVAASWDPALVNELGRLLAAEARRKGIDVVLAPTVNLHRTPYGGRHFECYSEDPFLTGDIGSAMVRGLQSQGVAAVAKHFVGNDSETERSMLNAVIDGRTLREVYLAPFETLVREAGVWMVMAAYNAVNGSTMTEHPLLSEVLREDWGFDGVTVTDWYAGRSTEATAMAALDLIMPGPTGPWNEWLVEAVRAGRVPEEVVDVKVSHLLRLARRVGAVDGPGPAQHGPIDVNQTAELVRRAARSSFVLVRNEGPGEQAVLPLIKEQLRSVAVIGVNASHARYLGGGSALVFPHYVVSPVDGLREALELDVDVRFVEGGRAYDRVAAADASRLTTPSGARGVELLFLDGAGSVLGSDERAGTTFNWNNAFMAGVEPNELAVVELRTVLSTEAAGDYRIGCSGVGRFQLFLDGRCAFDDDLRLPPEADQVEGLMRPPQRYATRRLPVGRQVDVVLRRLLEPREHGQDLLVSLQFNVDYSSESDEHAITRAAEAAAGADVAIVVVGTNEEVESEGFDRDNLSLPGRQDELVSRVCAVQPRTIVVVNAGAPVLMPWRDRVAAILLVWFPGQEFGRALADVLLGYGEPGGHLPTTWPALEGVGLPSTHPDSGKLVYGESLHVGYRRFLRDQIEPAYWFGHGLGYTTWSYESLEAAVTEDGVRVDVEVDNTGPRSGRHVVQIYLARADSKVERPVRWLAGYTTVDAPPGRRTRAHVALPWRRFAHWDNDVRDWIVEPGTFLVQVGRSAGDIVLETPVLLPVPPDSESST